MDALSGKYTVIKFHSAKLVQLVIVEVILIAGSKFLILHIIGQTEIGFPRGSINRTS